MPLMLPLWHSNCGNATCYGRKAAPQSFLFDLILSFATGDALPMLVVDPLVRFAA